MTAALLDPVAKAEYYYDYTGDDPINNIDPSGMCWTDLCWLQHTRDWLHRQRHKVVGAALIGASAVSAAATVAVGAGCVALSGLEPFHCLAAIGGGVFVTGVTFDLGIREWRRR